jgi:hypothetical protein
MTVELNHTIVPSRDIDAQGAELRAELRELSGTVHSLDLRLTNAGG